MNKNIYYVYEHIRLDNFIPIYVGMGKFPVGFSGIYDSPDLNELVKNIPRFIHIINSHLSRKEALGIREQIRQMYSILGINLINRDHKLIYTPNLLVHPSTPNYDTDFRQKLYRPVLVRELKGKNCKLVNTFNTLIEGAFHYGLFYGRLVRVNKIDFTQVGHHPNTGNPLLWKYGEFE